MKDRYLDVDTDALRLTLDEFKTYWLTPDEQGLSALDHFEVSIGEAYAQYRSECAMFGDAGPGQAVRIATGRAELLRVRHVLAKE